MAHGNILRFTTLAALLLATSSASAHILVSSPTPRVPDNDNLKQSPCGPGRTWGEGEILTYAPGEQVTVTWDETVTHAGYFRVVLSTTGDAGLTIPSEEDYTTFTDYYENGEMGQLPAAIENPMGTPDGDMIVYYDLYQAHPGGVGGCAGDSSAGGCAYTVTITLPQACEECTLQVVQTMAEPSRTYGSNAHYYQCIDITIDPTMVGGGGAGAGGGAGMAGGSGVGMGGSGNAMAGTSSVDTGVAGAASMSTGGMANTGTDMMAQAGAGTMASSGGATTMTATATAGAANTGTAMDASGTGTTTTTNPTDDTASGTTTTGTMMADTTGSIAMGGATTTGVTPGATTTTPAAASADEGGCALTPRQSGSWLLSGLAMAALALLRRRRD